MDCGVGFGELRCYIESTQKEDKNLVSGATGVDLSDFFSFARGQGVGCGKLATADIVSYENLGKPRVNPVIRRFSTASRPRGNSLFSGQLPTVGLLGIE